MPTPSARPRAARPALRRLAALLLAATALLTAGCSATRADGARDERLQQRFQALVDSYYARWTVHPGRGDEVPDRASVLYAQDADLVFFDVAPMKFTGWEEYSRGVMITLIDGIERSTFVPNDDLVVTRRGDLVWTTNTFQLSAVMKDGDDLSMNGRHTALWEKRGDRWLIVHEHLSTPFGG